jgi:LmbE family N-acetylglucosaminyl deacetylase
MPTALHVSPHPDDEVVGAPGTLLRLVDAGWRIVNLALSLGRPADRDRRHAELLVAAERMGLDVVVADPLVDLSSTADRARSVDLVTRSVVDAVTRSGATLVVGPSPHDGHHGHEIVGHGVWRAAAATGRRLWLWAVWADLAAPSLLVPVEERHLRTAELALSAYVGELARNDYRRLLEARATVAAVLGPERVFGFGGEGRPDRFCETLMDVGFVGGQPHLARPRVFVSGEEPAPFEPGPRLDAWIAAPSDRALVAAGDPNA